MRFFQHKWPAILLWPLSLLYGLVMTIRNILYDHGILKSCRVPCKVISVGNITVGGTGKTPTVITLAQALAPQKVCILSRGYGRVSKGNVIVSDYDQILAPVEQSGDEPWMMANTLPGVPVIVDEDRVHGARIAIDQFSPDVIILDDGFQHRRLQRDVDIVTMSGDHPFGNGMVLPAGPLREPLGNLQRGSAFWLNGTETLPKSATRYQRPVIKAGYHNLGLYNIHDEFVQDHLQNSSVLGFSGLGNPDNFKTTLHGMRAEIKMFIPFKDHHRYSREDIQRLEQLSNEHNTRWIVTTEKDRVKLPARELDAKKWGYIKIQIEPKNKPDFVSWVKSVSH